MEMKELRIDQIRPNPLQPREVFDKEKLKELAATITDVGVLQPILVRPKNGQYEIIAGERRWKATQIAGIETIPALIKPLPDSQVMVESLIENVHRANLKPIEQAKAILEVFRADEKCEAASLTNEELLRKLMNTDHKVRDGYNSNILTEEEKTIYNIVKKIGLTFTAVRRALSVLKLPESIQIEATEKRVAKEHLTSISVIKDEQDQKDVFDIVVEEELSRKDTAALTKVVKSAPEPVKRAVLDAAVPVDVAQTIIDTKRSDAEQEAMVNIVMDKKLSKEGTERLTAVVKSAPEPVKRAVLDAAVPVDVAQTIIDTKRSDAEQEAMVNIVMDKKLSKEGTERLTAVVESAPEPVKRAVLEESLDTEVAEEIMVAFEDLPDDGLEQVTQEAVKLQPHGTEYVKEHIQIRKKQAEGMALPDTQTVDIEGTISKSYIEKYNTVHNTFAERILHMPRVHQERCVVALLSAHGYLEKQIQILRKNGVLTQDKIEEHRAKYAIGV